MANTHRICSIADCGKKVFNRGWCAGHYHRWRKHGDPFGGRHQKTGCDVDGCHKSHVAKGYCADHYYRFKTYGDPLKDGGRTAPGALLEWLESHVDNVEVGDCIPWPFAKGSSGYGHMVYQGIETSAHRVMCEMKHGAPPSPDYEAAHSCNNRVCCNPNHLRWATKSENAADRIMHGTQAIGERNPAARVTADQVQEIRALRGKMSLQEIAAMFGITKSNVSCIHLRKSWAWLE